MILQRTRLKPDLDGLWITMLDIQNISLNKLKMKLIRCYLPVYRVSLLCIIYFFHNLIMFSVEEKPEDKIFQAINI